ncbi:hypothetical protein DsansV1_C24g0180611 [Dioscorea sansibarensis]
MPIRRVAKTPLPADSVRDTWIGGGPSFVVLLLKPSFLWEKVRMEKVSEALADIGRKPAPENDHAGAG